MGRKSGGSDDETETDSCSGDEVSPMPKAAEESNAPDVDSSSPGDAAAATRAPEPPISCKAESDEDILMEEEATEPTVRRRLTKRSAD